MLLEEKLRLDDIDGLNETYLSNFTCECAKLAREKEQLAMAVTAIYLIETNGKSVMSVLLWSWFNTAVYSYSRQKCICVHNISGRK